jgi:DNA repair protein RecO (recombination protein O)
MIEWRDEGVVLAVRPHGETSVIAQVFTQAHGLHGGIVRGGAGRRMASTLQPGSQVEVVWRARIEDHLGVFAVEQLRSRAAVTLGDRLALAGLNAIAGLLCAVLPEREEQGRLYHRTIRLLDLLDATELWPLAYLEWELALLEEMGFALDLGSCAMTGQTEDLAFVSPRTGRAVAREAAGPWADRLLPLPALLAGRGTGHPAEVAEALSLTGYFVANRLVRSLGDRPVPAARARLIEALSRQQ